MKLLSDFVGGYRFGVGDQYVLFAAEGRACEAGYHFAVGVSIEQFALKIKYVQYSIRRRKDPFLR